MQLSKKQFYHDNVRMTYYEVGNGKTLLFLHGGSLQTVTYRKNIALLSKKYRVIAPDIPCFGASDTPSDAWDFIDYAKYFAVFLKEKNLTDVYVVGHSFGGGIALALSVQTKSVKKLAVIDPSAYPTKRPFLRALFFFLVMKDLYDVFVFRNYPMIFIIAWDFFFGTVRKVLYLPRIVRTFVKATTRDYAFYTSIQQPTLILWGRDDTVHQVHYAYKLAEAIPNATLQIVKGHHDWCLFEPEEATKYIYGFDKDANKKEKVYNPEYAKKNN